VPVCLWFRLGLVPVCIGFRLGLGVRILPRYCILIGVVVRLRLRTMIVTTTRVVGLRLMVIPTARMVLWIRLMVVTTARRMVLRFGPLR